MQDNQNKKWLDDTWQKIQTKLSSVAVKSRDKIPYTAVNGVHDDRADNGYWWTNGFWGGLMWLMYSETKNEEYKITAKRSEELLDKAFAFVDKFDHDVGFVWHLVSGASYRLTGDKNSRVRNILAAMTLASRYNFKGGYIRAWNGKVGGEDTDGWTIIDCMMNLPLLYWASKELDDDRFYRIAVKHADMALKDHLREDGTVNHIVVHDTQSPKVLQTKAGQGYGVGSCWSRGQSWAVYGFILSYIYTGDCKYLDGAERAAEVYIRETEKTDWLPRCDFRQPDEPKKFDSTSGAVTACGLIEIAKYCSEDKREKYVSAAMRILQTMEKAWCDWSEGNDSILQMGLEAYAVEQHKNIIYGDFFFVEAVLKLKNAGFLIW